MTDCSSPPCQPRPCLAALLASSSGSGARARLSLSWRRKRQAEPRACPRGAERMCRPTWKSVLTGAEHIFTLSEACTLARARAERMLTIKYHVIVIKVRTTDSFIITLLPTSNCHARVAGSLLGILVSRRKCHQSIRKCFFPNQLILFCFSPQLVRHQLGRSAQDSIEGRPLLRCSTSYGGAALPRCTSPRTSAENSHSTERGAHAPGD